MFESGMETIRVDFHLHTKSDKEFKYNGDDNSFIKDYVKKLQESNIKIGIITNHNRFNYEEYKAIRKEARKHNIMILPGVEICTHDGKNGIHVLFVVNHNDYFKEHKEALNNAINKLFSTGSDISDPSNKADSSLDECIRIFKETGLDFFVICAHVNSDCGILAECDGGLIQQLFKKDVVKEYVLGLQKVTDNKKYNNFLQWTGKKHFASVEGSDPKSIDDIGKGKGKECNIKLGDTRFESLKYALVDSESRIIKEKTIIKHSYIDSIEFVGGVFDKKVIKLSPMLNSLIGIRGSGKSSLIECIRYAINIDANIDEQYKKGNVENTLQSAGKIIVNIVDKSGRTHKIIRIKGEDYSLFDGKERNDNFIKDIGNIVYFGQKDLSDKNNGYEEKLLDRIETQKEDKNELSALAQMIYSAITIYLLNEDKIVEVNEISSANVALKEKLKKFEENGIDKKLAKEADYHIEINKIEKQYDEIYEYVRSIENALNDSYKRNLISVNYESKYDKKNFNEINKLYSHIKDNLENIDKNKQEIKNNLEKIDVIINKAKEQSKKYDDEFQKIKRDILNNVDFDLDDFENWKNEISENEEKLKKLKSSVIKKEESIKKIKNVIKLYDDSNKKVYKRHEELIKKINESNIGKINIEIVYKGDKKGFKNDIKNEFNLKDEKAEIISNSFTDFIDVVFDCLVEDSKKMKSLNLTEKQKNSIEEHIRSNYEDILQLTVNDKIEIKYKNKKLQNYSLGQRAMALINLILAQNDSDIIIIDQPEDDLDSQVIYDELISDIKKIKYNTQLIFATHNANIPVLGDAERIVELRAEEDSKVDVISGSIDSEDSQQAIIKIMEGGSEAFKKRNIIYNMWK